MSLKSFFAVKSNYLYLAFVLELLLVFYLRNDTGFIVSPMLMLVSGLFLAYYPIVMAYKQSPILNHETGKKISTTLTPNFYWSVFVVFNLIYITWSFWLFQKNPLDVNQSDIIPFIKEVYLERLFRGEAVYSPFTGFQYGTFTPSYLPAHWAPFIVPYLLNIDLRWACVVIFSIASFVFANFVFKSDKSKTALIKMVAPWLLVFSIYLKQPKDAAHTIEIMVLGYYLLLGVLLFSSRALVQAFAIVLPLFSRYAFMFWLPVYACIQWLNSKKFFIEVLVWGIVLCAVVFLPFVIQTPTLHKGFNANYLEGVISEWKGQAWQQPGDRPFQLFQGMGVASWFYLWFDGTLTDKINATKNTLLLVSGLFMLLHIGLSWLCRKKIDSATMALLTLKGALTIFYLFVMVPYIYLNWVPLIISVVIISRIKIPHQNDEIIDS